ncbi:MAG: hypothetical protein R3F53_27945 [Gammaproteobacteria bacterium]
MRYLIIAFGLLVSGLTNAQDEFDCNWDRFLEGRPLWYTEDLRWSFWLVESEGQVVGHLQDSEGGDWYHLEFTDRTSDGTLFNACRREFTIYKPTYENGSIRLDEVDDFEFCAPAPPPALGIKLQALYLGSDEIYLWTDTDGIGAFSCYQLKPF